MTWAPARWWMRAQHQAGVVHRLSSAHSVYASELLEGHHDRGDDQLRPAPSGKVQRAASVPAQVPRAPAWRAGPAQRQACMCGLAAGSEQLAHL